MFHVTRRFIQSCIMTFLLCSKLLVLGTAVQTIYLCKFINLNQLSALKIKWLNEGMSCWCTGTKELHIMWIVYRWSNEFHLVFCDMFTGVYKQIAIRFCDIFTGICDFGTKVHCQGWRIWLLYLLEEWGAGRYFRVVKFLFPFQQSQRGVCPGYTVILLVSFNQMEFLHQCFPLIA